VVSRWVLDVGVLYGLLDAHRERLGVSWYRVARDLDLSPNVFSRMARGSVPDSHALGTLLMWLGWAPELALFVEPHRVEEFRAQVASADLPARVTVCGSPFVPPGQMFVSNETLLKRGLRDAALRSLGGAS